MIATDALPWDKLRLAETQVPWDALRLFADAAAESPDVRSRLLAEFEHQLDRRYGGDEAAVEDLTDLAVPAIIALAASRLDEAGRREAAVMLLKQLLRAGEEQDEWQVEVLMYAASHLGGPAAEEAIKAIEAGGWDSEAFFFLFGILRNTVREADAAVREGVIRHCRQMVATSPRRGSPWTPGFAPAGILSLLKDVESLPLLERLFEESNSGDVADSIAEMKDASQTAKWDEFEFEQIQPERWVPIYLQRIRESLLADVEEEEADALRSDHDPVYSFDEALGREAPMVPQGLFEPERIGGSRRVGRNEPCPCGSGRKHKKCCWNGR